MSGSEWFEAYTNASSNGLTALAILLTIVSGYMVIAYLVGEKLTKIQVLLVNMVYIASGLSVLTSNFGSVLDSATARAEAAQRIEQLGSIITPVGEAVPETYAIIVASVNSLFLIISLVFMWQVRHPKAELPR
ncbi:MAG: hypothetical protein ABJK25_18940 [Halieaceae bacterium]